MTSKKRASCGEMMTSKKRAKIITPGSVPALPEEIVTEVLLRLPVKSVLRCRAVCRGWSGMISSEEFVSRHMAKMDADAALAAPKMLLVTPTEEFNSNAVCLVSPSVPSADRLFTLDVCGDFVGTVPLPCQGLTLVHDAAEPAYYVCNAATRALTKLPQCPDMLQFNKLPWCLDVSLSTAGLGFDTRTKRFKVVRLFQESYAEQMPVRCEVYTLGGEHGNCWRPAVGGVPDRFCIAAESAIDMADRFQMPPVLANGFLHWLLDPFFIVKWPTTAILSFSLTDETFGWVQSPPFMASGGHLVDLDGVLCGVPPFMASGVHLVELDNHLCMVRDLRKDLPDGCMLEILKLQDYSSGVWSLDLRINLSGHMARDLLEPRFVKVVGSTGDGRSRKKIIIASSQHKVHIYDPMSEGLETILLTGDSHIGYQTELCAFRISLFKESLAPVHKTNEEIALSLPLAKAVKEILLRLPARSVLQFKLVCKLWCQLIESESFNRSYSLHLSIDKRPKIMLVGKGSGHSSFKFAPLGKWLQEALCQGAGLDTKVVCSKPCHGLNLISTTTKDYVYNPNIGFHLVRSHGPWIMPSDGCTQDNAFAFGYKNCSLGFDPVIQEHVIMRILYDRKDFKSREYSLVCSLWRCGTNCKQNDLPLLPLPVNEMPPAHLDGILYWMSDPRLGQSADWAIVAFDIAKGVFDVIPCPSCITKWSCRSCRNAFVVELGGILCVVLVNPVSDRLDIWKLENDQWDRAYTVCLKAWPDYSLRTNVVVPVAIDPNDGRILLNTGRRTGFYDPVGQTIENVYALDQMPLLTGTKQMPHLRVSQGFHITKCQQRSPAELSKDFSVKSLTCSSDMEYMEELNQRDTTFMPLVPMLYEESLACYPRLQVRKRTRLRR